MKRIRIHQHAAGQWSPVCWLLWDADETCLRLWDDETPVPQPALDSLAAHLMAGDPCGWIAADMVYVTHDEQPPSHAPTDRQRLGIRADAVITRELIRDRLRATVRIAEESAERLRQLLPAELVKELRANADLDEVFAAG
jgi:hypothetical protein